MRIRWTDPAETDLFEICDYVARDNLAVTERVGLRLLSAVDSLAAQPRLGRPGRVAGTRELVIPKLPYIVTYRIIQAADSTATEVEVMRVLHGARRRRSGGG